MGNRWLCVLALCLGVGSGFARAQLYGILVTKVVIQRLPAIENDTSDTITWCYPYTVTVYYQTTAPGRVGFQIDWGAEVLGTFPGPLYSGQLSDGTCFVQFGSVYQNPGNFNVMLDVIGFAGFEQAIFTISVPAKKAGRLRKSFRPKFIPAKPVSGDRF